MLVKSSAVVRSGEDELTVPLHSLRFILAASAAMTRSSLYVYVSRADARPFRPSAASEDGTPIHRGPILHTQQGPSYTRTLAR